MGPHSLQSDRAGSNECLQLVSPTPWQPSLTTGIGPSIGQSIVVSMSSTNRSSTSLRLQTSAIINGQDVSTSFSTVSGAYGLIGTVDAAHIDWPWVGITVDTVLVRLSIVGAAQCANLLFVLLLVCARLCTGGVSEALHLACWLRGIGQCFSALNVLWSTCGVPRYTRQTTMTGSTMTVHATTPPAGAMWQAHAISAAAAFLSSVMMCSVWLPAIPGVTLLSVATPPVSSLTTMTPTVTFNGGDFLTTAVSVADVAASVGVTLLTLVRTGLCLAR